MEQAGGKSYLGWVVAAGVGEADRESDDVVVGWSLEGLEWRVGSVLELWLQGIMTRLTEGTQFIVRKRSVLSKQISMAMLIANEGLGNSFHRAVELTRSQVYSWCPCIGLARSRINFYRGKKSTAALFMLISPSPPLVLSFRCKAATLIP